MMYLVMSWTDDDWPLVEGVFYDEQKARAVATELGRSISVGPIEPDVILPDRDDWPGSYYVYPDGQIWKDN